MATKTKATHRGNCQVCGHQQHVMGTILALHGYTVPFGYFQGTCHGSGHQPVQTERTLTDATIVGLGQYAAECDDSAAKLQDGTVNPSRIQNGRKFNRATNQYEPVYIDWKDGTLAQQTKAVELAVAGAESDARHARAHARSLTQMATLYHGKPLVAIADMAPAPKAPEATVDVKAAKVVGAFPNKAARKVELERVNHLYTKQIDKLQELYLALPHAQRTDANTEVYYAPMYPHQWKPRHSAAALKEFPQAAAIVKEIELLVKVREVIKAAP